MIQSVDSLSLLGMALKRVCDIGVWISHNLTNAEGRKNVLFHCRTIANAQVCFRTCLEAHKSSASLSRGATDYI